MNKLNGSIFFGIAILFMFSCSQPAERDPLNLFNELKMDLAPNTISRGEKQNGWLLLFDGSTTDNWRGYNMNEFPDSWDIQDGSLTMSTRTGGESKDIITTRTYGNFAFSVEFKLSKAGNSGVIFQVAEDPGYKYPYETGPEFQIIDHDNWHNRLEDNEICGANYAMYPPVARPYKPLGEWNHILIVVDGNSVTQMLNGEIVVEYEKNSEDWLQHRDSGKWKNFPDYGKFNEGHIALQNHGTVVWFRNIKLKEL